MMPFASSMIRSLAASVIDGTQGSVNAGILAAVYFSWNGSSVTVIGQKNVASVARNTTGKFRISFSSALANTNYGVIAGGRFADSSDDLAPLIVPCRNSTSGHNSYSTSAVDIVCSTSRGSISDPQTVGIVIFDPSAVGSDYLAACSVTISGTAPTVQLQTNVASAPRQTTGVYTPTFSSALGNSDYSAFTSSRYADFTNDASAFSGRNRNSTGPINRQSTSLIDLSVGQIAHVSGASSFDPGRFAMLLRNSDVAPRGTLAAARFSVSGGVCTLIRSWNVSSVSYQAAGLYRVNFTAPFADTDYCLMGAGKWPDFAGFNDVPLIGMNRNSSASRNVHSVNAVDISSTSYGSGSGVFEADIVDVWVLKPWLM